MPKYSIRKGQTGFSIDWGSGLDPMLQKSIWETLNSSAPKVNVDQFNPIKLPKIDYLKGTPKTTQQSQTDADKVMSGISSTLSSLPIPEAKAIGTALAVAPVISGGIGNLAELLGGENTNIENAKGFDKVYNFVLKYNPWLKYQSQVASALTGNTGLKTKIETDTDLTKDIVGYGVSDGVPTTEVSKMNDFFTGLWGANKSKFNQIKDQGLGNYLKTKSSENISKIKSDGIFGETGWLKSKIDSNKALRKENSLSTTLQEKANKIDYDNFLKQVESRKARDVMELSQASYRDVLNKNQQMLSGGRQFLLAKSGLKFPQLKKIKSSAKKVSVIPDGKLHSRINNHGEDVTPKGIPVVTYEREKTIQHAEIEKEELILNIDITKKLENLWKKYKDSKDEKFLIEAGKLLSTEILENTQDNVGLLQKV